MTPLTKTREKEPVADVPATVPAITVHDVSKSFRIPHDQLLTFKERALHPVKAFRNTHDELRAVSAMDFEIGEGEFFGIVGRNGSGKSTLLKCIAGRLSPFIELGVGFNPDLTARDNVILNAILLGLSRKEARARFDEIIEFAELEGFVDLRLKNYSSGMQVRLAFAVAIQVDAEILLIDEVLAVGDASFQQKCFAEFNRLKAEGRTIVLVTHDMHAVQRYCDRAMLIEKGAIMDIGEPREMTRKYNELNFGRSVHELPAGEEERYGDHRVAEIRAGWFEDGEGEHVGTVGQGQPCAFCFEVYFHTEIENPVFAVSFLNEVGITVFATSSYWDVPETGVFESGTTITIRIPFDNRLSPSTYAASPSIAREGMGADALDVREGLASLHVHGTRHTGGAADLRHEFQIRRP